VFIDQVPSSIQVILTGAKGDAALCEFIKNNSSHPDVINAAGQYSFHQSAALMKGAVMNYVNDSAPLHFASAVNAPVTAVFCSTVPGFGFGPLSDVSYVVETDEILTCRPCGLHGKRTCPEGHFRCSHIQAHKLKHTLPL
jgi:heptosyltransferase-2